MGQKCISMISLCFNVFKSLSKQEGTLLFSKTPIQQMCVEFLKYTGTRLGSRTKTVNKEDDSRGAVDKQ